MQAHLDANACLTANISDIHEWNSIDELLCQLGKWAIDNNAYRRGDAFYYISDSTTKLINEKGAAFVGQEGPKFINGGYLFLDDPKGTVGMIRLYYLIDNDPDQVCNPKWTFDKKGDEMKTYLA